MLVGVVANDVACTCDRGVFACCGEAFLFFSIELLCPTPTRLDDWKVDLFLLFFPDFEFVPACCWCLLQACGRMLADDYDTSVFVPEDGVAVLHVAALLLDASPSAAGHMVSIGAVPLFLSR